MSAGEPGAERPRASLGGLLRHSSIYGVVPLVQRAAALFLVPLYTSYLVVAEYGVIELTDLLVIALAQLVGNNVLQGMTRFYFEARDERDRAAVVTSVTLVTTLAAWTAVGLLLVLGRPVVDTLFDRADPSLAHLDLREAFVLALVTLPFMLSTQAGFEFLKIRRRSGLFAGLQIGKLLLEIGLKVWFLVGLGWGLRGFLLSNLIGEALTTLVLTAPMIAGLRARISWRVLRPILAFSAPLIPVGLIQLGIHQLDRFLLRSFGPSMDAVGIYGLGYKVGYLVNAVVFTSFLQIWYPWIYALKDARERAVQVARASTYAVLVVGSASIVLILFGRQFVHVLSGNDDYHPAYRIVPWVATGYVLWALYGVSQTPLYVAKRTWPIFWINLVALAANVALNASLIPAHGAVGAAWATAGTFATLAVLGMWTNRRIAEVPYELGRLAAVVAAVLLSAFAARWLDGPLDANPWSLGLLAVKLAGSVAALFALWFGVLRAEERARMIAMVRARLGARG